MGDPKKVTAEGIRDALEAVMTIGTTGNGSQGLVDMFESVGVERGEFDRIKAMLDDAAPSKDSAASTALGVCVGLSLRGGEAPANLTMFAAARELKKVVTDVCADYAEAVKMIERYLDLMEAMLLGLKVHFRADADRKDAVGMIDAAIRAGKTMREALELRKEVFGLARDLSSRTLVPDPPERPSGKGRDAAWS